VAWVRFTEPFDWTPPESPRTTIAYPLGPFPVRKDCADKAVKAKKAVRIQTPKRGEDARSGQAEGSGPVPAPGHD
jgi:hypothetical protein